MENQDPNTRRESGKPAQPDDLPEFSSAGPAVRSNPDLEMILDIPIRLSMEIGNTQISEKKGNNGGGCSKTRYG